MSAKSVCQDAPLRLLPNLNLKNAVFLAANLPDMIDENKNMMSWSLLESTIF